MSSCHTFRPVPGQCGPRGRGPLPAPPFDPQDYWATRKLVSSLFGTLETSKLDKADVVDPAAATEDGKAADAKKTKEELDRVLGVASGALALAESKADKLSGRQLEAVNSGIDANKVAKIAQNESAISAEVSRATTEEARLQALINAIKTFDAVVADSLPTPSEQYSKKLYLVPSTNPETRNVRDEFICVKIADVWKWEQVGSTAITIEFDDEPTEGSQKVARSGGIWSWVKSLLPRWLTSDYAEPATVASVANKRDSGDFAVASSEKSGFVDLDLSVQKAIFPGVYTWRRGIRWRYEILIDGKLAAISDEFDSEDESKSVRQFSIHANNYIYRELEGTTVRVVRYVDGPDTLVGAKYVDGLTSTNNPSFVSAVQNTPTSGMPEDMPTDWGTFGMVGAALAALAAGLKWCKNILGSLASGYSTFAAWIASKLDRASLLTEYSPSSAYAVGSIVYHEGNIYQCKTAIAEGGEAWNAEHWELRKLDDFFTESNSLLTGTIDGRLPIPISGKSEGFTTESYKRFIVTVSGDMTVTLHTPTSEDAEIFECRFDGTSLSADASITFTGATATTMDANCGTVTAGKIALMSAFWNGATWDVNWKVEG